jgi:phosphate/phosphite/phosphonate ABC transporter binding protein
VIACASFLGENARPVYARIVTYLAARTGLEVELLPPLEWNEQHRQLDEGRIQVAFLCGQPYVEKHDRPGGALELLAAPVMAGARYQGRPVYFTDVIVRTDAPARSFADLRGLAWAYNGTDSNSGYTMPRDHLLALGETAGFFGRVMASGSHQRSIEMVLSGEADVAGIDSAVLNMELALRPELCSRLRVVESIGPCPIPPVVASCALPPDMRAALREALLAMHMEAEGKQILESGQMACFVEVEDADYNPIREMLQRARDAHFLELK